MKMGEMYLVDRAGSVAFLWLKLVSKFTGSNLSGFAIVHYSFLERCEVRRETQPTFLCSHRPVSILLQFSLA